MKTIFLFAHLLLLISVTGCIKDAPSNPEADIESFIIPDSLTTSGVVIDQANRKIQLYLKPAAFQRGIAPVLQLSSGASVSPASGDSIHFGQAANYYTVTSQSGENQKKYEVEVVEIGNWTFNFENWSEHPVDKYQFPVEQNNVQLWSSGNPGIALAGVDKRADAYPTRAAANIGWMGTKAAELVTIPGTPLSMILGIRLFAGSFFLGDFNSTVALANPLAATEFGQPYFDKPARFTGYYQYTPGANFQDADGTILPGQTDKYSLYAVLYNGPTRLNGTNINTSDSVIARAIVPSGTVPATLTRFDAGFEYIPGRTLGNNLMVAIVASSSSQGDLYKGAIGSRLVLDSIRIIPQ